ncbi:hypothetical protein B0O99DRAFT_527006 [Bisporella sp. PMI_857]|nr:hypothetical protein B0O99DRAFT_527006 [Bisporella sp. PMI_857]
MTYLIQRVSEEARLQEYETIAAYVKENQQLERELRNYRNTWNATITLANYSIIAIAFITKSLKKVKTCVASSNKDWLAFWGIYEECPGSHPLWI